ncbi:zinc finger CW-type PWWP domain protein 1-like [Chiloscyllium plagiosum]|uniref:zinc finger CW-type PWWP domain protein 1-like n=1 Tax=Chiloscyllium plagiosum TaxID=36176 RepID=UPI001CB826DD|nr:zinc finger CW-type PWWP domain protein 1-like [Chiloscyllium plagiosum]
MNQVKLLRELRFRERTMKDFEELRKLCCADNPGTFEVSAASNGIEKNTKRGVCFIAPGAKDGIMKPKKRKEVLCENSSAGVEGQNRESAGGTFPDMEKRDQKSFTVKKKKALLEKRQAMANADEGCITKPEKVSVEEKVKRKAKCVGGVTKTNKPISTLSDIQYEKIFQSVIDKSLEECIASSKKLIRKVKSLQENSEPLLVSENIVPSEPSVTKSSEHSEAPGVRKTKAKSKENKAHKLSRKSKLLIDTNETSEVSREGRRHKRKGQPKKIVQDYTKFIDDDEESALDKYVSWVQCSKEKCGKWRRLEDNVDPATLPDDWVCSQNPDPLYNMCDLPEEVWDGRENDVIYAELVPGSIVWAKQFGYPWWPGMVEHDPQTGKYFMFTTDSDQFPSKYHITFFDTTVSHAWIPVPLIKSFQEIPQERNMAKRDFSKRVNTAKKMAEEAQKVKIQDRISQFGFIVRYKGIEGAKLSEDSSSQESLEDPCIVKDAKRPASRNKETRSKDCAEKEPENHQLTVRKGKGKNGGVHLATDQRTSSKQESPVPLRRKALLIHSKQFRGPILKRDSSGSNQRVTGKSAISNGIDEMELVPLKAKVTEHKVSGHDRTRRKDFLSPKPYTQPSVATDLHEEESLKGKKPLLQEPPSPPGGGPAGEGFAKLLQGVMEKKQDADTFSDDDMAILTLKKSEDEEEFADFMFEE